MKKFILCALSGLVFTANAQNVYQVQNSDFEEWEGVSYTTSGWRPTTYTGDEPLHWNSFLTGDGSLKGTAGRNQLEKSSEVRPGSTGNQSAKIFDRTVLGSIIAQGNLTTGRINMGNMNPAEAKGNYNFTITDDDAFNQKFTGRPDAMVVWVKYVSTGGFNAKANTVLHTEGYYQDPEGNTITATVIAKAENTSIASSNEWQKLTIPFDYKDAGRPAYALVSFATNVTPGKGTGKDYMLIDDLEYIYNYSLTSATCGTDALPVPAAGETANCEAYTYDEATVTFTTDGIAASVEKAYDAENCVLTVTVKADDYEVSGHENVYKFQFAKPAASVPSLASLKISGENFVLTEDVTEYELPYVYNKGIVFEPVADEESTLGDVVYNDEDKTVSITVKSEKGKETVYVFRFGQLDETAAESGDYNGALSVVLITPDATSNGLLNNAAIALTKNASGTYNLTLNDFSFMGMLVGDIFVPNITLTDGKLEATRTIMITSATEGAMGPMLGALPVKVSASLIDTDLKAAAASIDILTSESPMLGSMFQGIHVDFVPYEVEAVATDGAEWSSPQHYENVKVSGRVTKETAKFLHINNNYVNSEGVTEEYPMTYIDMTGATVDADVTYADIMTGAPEKNNTLIYLPANSKLTDANTVVSGKATALALTEKVALYVPVAFTAGSISFDRTFNTEEGKVSSFVMPFELKADNVEGKLYTFKGINGEKAEFKKLENTETLAANIPCLIVAENAHPFDGVKNVSVAATEGEMTNTVGNAAHIGTYTTQTVTSDATTTYYGYQNGEFVKANNGTLNPFRTMIKVTGTVTAQALKLKLNDETTGISEATNEAGKADVYTLDGKCVRRGVAAKEALNGLGKGVYVVNGRKIVK